MNRFSKHRIKNEADAIVAAWSRIYSKYRLKKVNLENDSREFADQFIGQFSLNNANKVTLEVWRRYCHVLPVKGDVTAANIKRMINAVRRHIAQAKKDRVNINKAVKASIDTSAAFSRDL